MPLTLIGKEDNVARQRGLCGGGNSRYVMWKRRTLLLSGSEVKFLLFTVIYVVSPDCLSGVNP